VAPLPSLLELRRMDVVGDLLVEQAQSGGIALVGTDLRKLFEMNLILLSAIEVLVQSPMSPIDELLPLSCISSRPGRLGRRSHALRPRPIGTTRAGWPETTPCTCLAHRSRASFFSAAYTALL